MEIKKTAVALTLALALTSTIPAEARSSGRGQESRPASTWTGEILQLWHHALSWTGLEKDGVVPPPPPSSSTSDGGSCADPNGCVPPKS
jgi:hypothetical protein